MPERDIKTQISVLATVQGIYYLITGIWPIIHMSSFLAITGPKVDLWLVNTVGMLIFFLGTGLILAGLKRQVTFPLSMIAAGTTLGLFLVDIIYVWSDVISAVYLLDAILEIGLFITWCVVIYRSGLFIDFIEAPG